MLTEMEALQRKVETLAEDRATADAAAAHLRQAYDGLRKDVLRAEAEAERVQGLLDAATQDIKRWRRAYANLILAGVIQPDPEYPVR